MCGTNADAVRALDQLLKSARVPVAKAMDLSTRAGFDRAAAKLSAELARRTGAVDAKMVRESIGVLKVPWHSTTPEQRARLIDEAAKAAKKTATPIITEIRAPFDEHAEEVVRGTKLELRNRQKLAVQASFTQLDRKVVSHCTRFQSNFVTDEYGNRCDTFSVKARELVASGLKRGISDDDIGEELQGIAEASFLHRSPTYWDVVACAFTGHSRSYSQVSSYTEAKISQYRIVAVLDEVTTPQCRFLDGKVFSVKRAMSRFQEISGESDPERIKQISPWVRVGNIDGKPSLYVGSGDAKTRLAEVVRSGVGASDDRGEYRAHMDEGSLESAGVSLPPFHGRCRTSTIGVV